MAAFFVLTFVLVPIVIVFALRYFKLTFGLLEEVRRHEPELWQALDRPERIFVSHGDSGMTTIKPIGPWLSWILGSKAFGPIPRRIRRKYRAVRQSGFIVLASMGVGAFLFTRLP